MSLKGLFGLNECNISEAEIMRKYINARRNGFDTVEFIREDGSVVKISLPHMQYDPFMDAPDTW